MSNASVFSSAQSSYDNACPADDESDLCECDACEGTGFLAHSACCEAPAVNGKCSEPGCGWTYEPMKCDKCRGTGYCEAENPENWDRD